MLELFKKNKFKLLICKQSDSAILILNILFQISGIMPLDFVIALRKIYLPCF